MGAGGDSGFAGLGWLVVTVGLQWFVFVCDLVVGFASGDCGFTVVCFCL